MITGKDNVFRFIDVGRDTRDGVIEGVVAYMYINEAKSYSISGAMGNSVVVPFENTGVWPGGVNRIMAEDGTTMVAEGEVVCAVYE